MSIMQNDPDEKQKKFAEQMERKIRRRSIKNHAFAYWIELLTEILEDHGAGEQQKCRSGHL